MTARLTPHTITRVKERLAGIVKLEDIQAAIAAAETFENERKIYAIVKKYGKTISVKEDNYRGGNGSGINGDCLVAVIKNGKVATIMLSKSYNKKYFNDARLVEYIQ